MTKPLSGPPSAAQSDSIRVRKIYNNNTVLAVTDSGEEVILLGRGVGFNTRPGREVPSGIVERFFVSVRNRDTDAVARLVEHLSLDDIRLATEIIEEGRRNQALPIDDSVVVPLADHLSFAFERVRTGRVLSYPFEWEVSAFYPGETRLARWAIGHIKATRDVEFALGRGSAAGAALRQLSARG